VTTGATPEALSAMAVAKESFEWYARNARLARLRFQVAEVVLLTVAAAVPIAGILTPDDSRLAAILGAVVVALTGLRTLFHWHDNWTRFASACSAISAEVRLYYFRVAPYDNPGTRDQHLVKRVNDVENTEVGGWLTLSTPQTSQTNT
jgi:hypothetical protein